MAWTTPKTWASGYVVLAADLNTHLRDNISLTAPAVMSAQGDIVIASGANTPIRLAKSTTSTQYLANTGTSNAPEWNEVALATGVSGTLPVGNGGTGQTSLTTGAILIGNSTSAVTMVTQTTKGQILIGDGSGPPQMLAVGTNDHVLTADSGETTGIKWAAAGGVTQAVQADIEAETNENTYIPPDLIKYSPGVAKVWGEAAANGASILASYNVASLTDHGTGSVVWYFTTSFSGTGYGFASASQTFSDGDLWAAPFYSVKTAGAIRTIATSEAGRSDAIQGIALFGDQ